MDIEITPDKEKKSVLSLEEKITKVANSWAESLLNDSNLWTTEALTDAVNEKISDQLGFRIRDDWRGTRLEIDLYSDRPISKLVREYADREIARIVSSIKFEPVVLSERELRAIKSAYNARIKEEAIEAARNLAERQAIELAKTVLGLED
jgi:hypothetical protein